jgi:hypothetical protein
LFLDLSAERPLNVQVLGLTLAIPVGVPVREKLNIREGLDVYLAAVFPDAL